MKKIKLLVSTLAVAGLLASCSDDSTERTISAQPPITGKWYYSQQGQSINGEDFLADYTSHIPGCSKDNIVLGTDNSYRRNDYSEQTCQEVSTTSTYLVDNNFITFGTGAEANTYEIESVTANTLRLRQAEGVDGVTVYLVETYTRN
jgi:hypothetical protein